MSVEKRRGRDIPALARRAYGAEGTPEDVRRLWQAAFELQEWVFIPRGPAGEWHPYVAQANEIEPETYWLYAFTDPEQAKKAATRRELVPEGGSFMHMTMPSPASDETLATILGYADHGVKGIYFNCDDGGFYAPFGNLKPILENLKSDSPKF